MEADEIEKVPGTQKIPPQRHRDTEKPKNEKRILLPGPALDEQRFCH
jgi:hypothetical protein